MKKILWLIGLLLLGGAGYWAWQRPVAEPAAPAGKPGAGRPFPVQAVVVKPGDIDITLAALGTVTARNTVTVKPRVDGQLVRINFREGERVKAGEVLAEIDPRPFQAQLDQVSGQLARDQALLANARLDLERYRGLLAKDSIAKQQVDVQEAQVRQYEGVVKADQALVDSAQLQLSFTKVTAPLAGRLGLRQVDVGNMVRSSDAAGLVVITQTQPINVLFTIPSDNLSPVVSRLRAGESLTVEAFERDGKAKLATGHLQTVDNQIDTATGTVKLKAEFANADDRLFPNQFVNVRLHVEKREAALLIPLAALQRGVKGNFVYVVGQEGVVNVRQVTVGPSSGNRVAIEQGLADGEQVATDGLDKLRDGAKVEVTTPGAGAKGGEGKGKGKGEEEMPTVQSGMPSPQQDPRRRKQLML